MNLLVKANREGPEIVRVTPQSAGWNYVGFAAYRLDLPFHFRFEIERQVSADAARRRALHQRGQRAD